jgi:hypothetical protein
MSFTVKSLMLSSLVTHPEDRALLGSNPSAEVGAKTKEGSRRYPLSLTLFGIGIKAKNPRGPGTESPQIGSGYPHQIAKNQIFSVCQHGDEFYGVYLSEDTSGRNPLPQLQPVGR